MQPTQDQPEVPQQQGFYKPAQSSPYQPTPLNDAPPPPNFDEHEVVEWEASEYIHRHKNGLWIAGFAVIVATGLGLAIWLQAWTFAVLVVAMAIATGVFAFRSPRVKHYSLSHEGLKIDDKLYNMSDFRAFGVLPEDAFFSVMLLPTARFKPAVNVYFAETDGEKIVDILGLHLPMQELQPDPIDVIMRRLHF